MADADAIRAHQDAKQDLHALQERQQREGVTEVTDEYLELNRRVIATEARVPWWRR